MIWKYAVELKQIYSSTRLKYAIMSMKLQLVMIPTKFFFQKWQIDGEITDKFRELVRHKGRWGSAIWEVFSSNEANRRDKWQ